MTAQAVTRILYALLVIHLVLFVGSGVEDVIHTKTWDAPMTTTDIGLAIVAVFALIAYVVGVAGLFAKRTWGLVLFGAAFVPMLLPAFNDPASATKLSMSLESAHMLVAGLIIGLVVFAMQDQFRGTRRQSLASTFS